MALPFRWTIALVAPVLLLALWQYAVTTGIVAPSQSVAPSELFGRMTALIGDRSFLAHLLTSLLRLVTGVLLGALLGTITGVFVATRPELRLSLAPLLGFFAGLPIVVWMPFWIMLFGIGETFRVGLVAIGTFFLVYASVFNTVRQTRSAYREMLQIYEKGALAQLTQVYLPAASLAVFTSVRVALAIGWIVLFFVEYAISERGREGLGWFIANARAVGRVDDEFAGLMFLGIIAFTVDALVALAQRRSLRWSL